MPVVNIRYVRSYDVYIGRAGRGESGELGNPVRIGYRCVMCNEVHDTAGSTLPCYEQYARDRIATDPTFKARVKALQDKTLACFCKPGPCHGDVLEKLSLELNRS